MTAEEWAPYGIGEPDADGWYPAYRQLPEALRTPPAVTQEKPVQDVPWLHLVQHWSLVIADLSRHHGIDLYDPAVLARPWPGIRTLIFSLLDEPTRLREALTRR